MTDMPPPYPGINDFGYKPSAHGNKSHGIMAFLILETRLIGFGYRC